MPNYQNHDQNHKNPRQTSRIKADIRKSNAKTQNHHQNLLDPRQITKIQPKSQLCIPASYEATPMHLSNRGSHTYAPSQAKKPRLCIFHCKQCLWVLPIPN